MSVVPPAIAGVGATTQRLAQNPRFDPLKAGFGTEEYFVWSRFDGTTSVKDLILMTGLPTERAIAIVADLWQRGAILAPGDDPGAALARGTGTVPAAGTAGGVRLVAPTVPVAGPATATTPRAVAPAAPTPPGGARTPIPPPPRGATPPPVVPRPPSTPPPVAPRPPTAPPVATRPPTTPPVAARATTAPPVGRAATTPPPPAPPRTKTGETVRVARVSEVTPVPELTSPTAAELVALAETSALSDADRRRVLAVLRLVAAGDPWALLGVARGSDKRALKRGFFERSKLFHPDRYFGKELGPYAARLHAVFEALTRAHTELTDDGASRRTASTEATAPQTPAEYAAELFDRACVAEVSGDAQQALKLFAAAVKLDGQARYLRRAAVCALGAGELRTAEDYAKKAAALDGSDPSTARILGKVLRALGKLDSAEEVLVMALAMKSENDTLMLELVSDLRAIRADLAR